MYLKELYRGLGMNENSIIKHSILSEKYVRNFNYKTVRYKICLRTECDHIFSVKRLQNVL